MAFEINFWGKTTILNAGISKRVFQNPLGALGAPGRVRVVDGQVG